MAADTNEYIRRRIDSWVKTQINQRNPRYGTCERIVLRHLRADGIAASEVFTWLPQDGQNQGDPAQCDIVIGELSHAAADHANGLGPGVQRYGLYAYFSNLQTSPSCTTVMVTSDSLEMNAEMGGAMGTEPANVQGQLSMQMRHNDAIMRTSVMSMGGVVAALQRNLEKFAEHNEKLIDDRMKTLHLIEDLISGKHQRDMDLKAQEFRQGLQTELLDKVKVLLPFMVNKMVGKSVLPEASTPEAILVRSIVETLTVDQVEGLKKVLRPEQLIGMMELAESMVKKSGEMPGMSNVPKLHEAALKDNSATGEESAGSAGGSAGK